MKLMQACAVLKGSKWEEIAVYLCPDALDDIRKSHGGNVVFMFKVLETWKLAKSRTVGELMKWFKQVGVDRSNIEEKYVELFGDSE